MKGAIIIDPFKNHQSMLIFIIANHTNTSHLVTFSNIWLKITLGILLIVRNNSKLKWPHNLVVDKH